MRRWSPYLIAGALVAVLAGAPAAAQQGALSDHNTHNQPLDAEGVLTWDALANLDIRVETPAPLQTVFYVEFPESLKALDGTVVRMKGFMYPLEAGEAHDKFLLAALPPACPFCLPGNAKTLVDVIGSEPIRYTLDPVVLEGKFTILENDITGFYYRLSDAGQVE